jgi:hypothetical protein
MSEFVNRPRDCSICGKLDSSLKLIGRCTWLCAKCNNLSEPDKPELPRHCSACGRLNSSLKFVVALISCALDALNILGIDKN